MAYYTLLNFKKGPRPVPCPTPDARHLQIDFPQEEDLKEDLLTNYPNIQHLHIDGHGTGRVTRLPRGLLAPVQLFELRVCDCKLTDLPDSLATQAPKLQRLDISQNQFEALPLLLRQLRLLTKLTLQGNPLKSLPDWLAELPNLGMLNIENTHICELPDSLAALHKLWYINARGTAIVPDLKLLFGLPKLRDAMFDKRAFGKAWELQIFVESAEQSETPQAAKMPLWRLMIGEDSYETANISLLLEALRLRHWPTQYAVQAEIARRFAGKSLTKGAKVVFLGLVPLERKGLVAKMRAAGLVFHTEILPSTTHIVVAELPRRVGNIDFDNYTFLTVRDLLNYLRPALHGHLLEGDNSTAIANLNALLLTGQAENIELAYEFIKAGGLPEGIVTGLFYIMKAHQVKQKYKTIAREWLQWLASPALLHKMRYKIDIYCRYLKAEQRAARINEFAGFPELDIDLLPR